MTRDKNLFRNVRILTEVNLTFAVHYMLHNDTDIMLSFQIIQKQFIPMFSRICSTLFLSYEQASLQDVIDTLDLVERNMGLKVSYEKTCRIGSITKSNAKLYTTKSFNWTDAGLEVLGVELVTDTPHITKVNFQEIISKAESVLSSRKNQGLTLSGRILVINTLVGSLCL